MKAAGARKVDVLQGGWGEEGQIGKVVYKKIRQGAPVADFCPFGMGKG